MPKPENLSGFSFLPKPQLKELMHKLTFDPAFRAEFTADRQKAIKKAGLTGLDTVEAKGVVDKINMGDFGRFINNRVPGNVAIEVTRDFKIK